MTNKPLESETVYGIDGVYETLRIRLPQSTIAKIDKAVSSSLRYHSNRSEFIFCALEYGLYCVEFDERSDWLMEDPTESASGQTTTDTDVPNE